MKTKLELIKGDITTIKVDAIVNAANSSLLGGGGVDGAIHRVGGSKILEECRMIRNRQGKCKKGYAVYTTAGLLQAKYVIHTVGPVWYKENDEEKEILASCYKRCLELADSLNVSSIAFPNISTGVYRFPKNYAAEIAISTTLKYIKENDTCVEKIVFVCFDEENYHFYENFLSAECMLQSCETNQ